jgi:hypothetical protein
MYGIPFRVREFARMTNGQLRPIQNFDLIYAGETLYHVPTYHARQAGTEAPGPSATGHVAKPGLPTGPALSPDEKEQVALQHLVGEFHLKGEELEWISEIVHGVDITEDVVKIIEIVLDMLHVEVAALETIGTALGILNVVLTPVVVGLSITHAVWTGHRLVQMAAMAVALTAWAYDEETPRFPDLIRRQYHNGPADLRADEDAWRAGCALAAKAADNLVIRVHRKVLVHATCPRGVVENVLKLLLRSDPKFGGRKDIMAFVLAKQIVRKAPHSDRFEDPVIYMATSYFNPNFDRRSAESL